MNSVRHAPLLAAALLGGEWTRADMEDRAVQMFGWRPPGLRRLLSHTLRTFHRAPRHELSVLAAFLEQRRAFWDGLDLSGRPSHVAQVVPARVAMASLPVEREAWGLPVLDTEQDLARLLKISSDQLDWFAARRDGKPWRGSVNHYRHHFAPKAVGVRLLESPMAGLKAIQRELLHTLLDRIPAHPAACGFVRGRSVLDHARPHVGRRAILRLDLEDFFASISAARVFGVFHGAGYPEAVSRRLTGLCTHRTPSSVFLHLLPPATGEEARRRYRLKARVRAPHLPQGAPTSPALANLVSYRLDLRLTALAEAAGGKYTRYADDLAFSGGAHFARATERFGRAVAQVVSEEGFRLNSAKTRTMGQGGRQSLCGVVVNQLPNVPRDEYDLLKATLHNCVRHGPAAQNREGRPDFRDHLRGRVAWTEQVNPLRGAKLRKMFERITW